MTRCLPTLALLAMLLPAKGQFMAPVGVDLFGDAIVKPIDIKQGRVVSGSPEKVDERFLPYQQVIFLADGRQLHGQVVEVTPTEVIWARPDLSEPLRVERTSVRRIVLRLKSSEGAYGPTTAQPAEQPVGATVKLPGSDWLFGDVRTEDGENFTLKLRSGGELKFVRERIEWIYFDSKPAPAFGFSGSAMSMAGWTGASASDAVVEDGVFRLKSTGYIGRDLAAPERFEVDFEVPESDAQRVTRLWLQPFRPQPNSYSTGTVELSFTRTSLERLIFINQFQRETTPMPADAENGPIRYRVFYDGPGARLSIVRNGKLLDSWSLKPEQQEARARPNHPRGIAFDRGNSSERLALKRLRVQPWDGVLPTEDGPTEPRISTPKEPARNGRIGRITESEVVFGESTLQRAPGVLANFMQQGSGLASADALLLFGANGEVAVNDLQIRDGRVLGQTSLGTAFDLPAEAIEVIVLPSKAVERKEDIDTLVFRNGDSLGGRLISAHTKDGLAWASGAAQLKVQPEHVAGVRFARNDPAQSAIGSAVELLNGDRMRGALLTFSEESLHLRHGTLGDLKVPRSQVYQLFPAGESTLHDAATEPERWQGLKLEKNDLLSMGQPPVNVPERIVLDGTFLTPAGAPSPWRNRGLSFNFEKVPDRYELRCEATDAGAWEPYMNVSLSGNNGMPSVQLNLGYGMLRMYGYNTGRRQAVFQQDREISLASRIPQLFSRREMRLFVDSLAGTVDVMVDGVHLAKYGKNAADRAPGIGARITLSSYGTSQGVSLLSNVRILPWNGDVPRAPDQGSIQLANGDSADAMIGAIRDGNLVATLEGEPMEVPLKRITAIRFPGNPTPEKAVARLRLRDGTVLHLTEFAVEQADVRGVSAIHGNLRVPRDLVAELVLSPAPPRFPKLAPLKQVAQDEPTPGAVPGNP